MKCTVSFFTLILSAGMALAENMVFNGDFELGTGGFTIERHQRIDTNASVDFVPLKEERNCPIEEARQKGAMMLFGEKYGDRVRVIQFGTSVELCGGTHVAATGQIGMFKILSESAISAGVRRIEAVTGQAAEEYVYGLEDTLREVQGFVNNPSVKQAVKKLLDENAELSRELENARKERVEALKNKIASDLHEENGMVLVARQVDLAPSMIKDMAWGLKDAQPKLVLVIGSVVDEKPTLTVMLGPEIVARGIHAGQVVREAAREIQGGGGGQPFFATAGGKNPAGIERAILRAVELIKTGMKE